MDCELFVVLFLAFVSRQEYVCTALLPVLGLSIILKMQGGLLLEVDNAVLSSRSNKLLSRRDNSDTECHERICLPRFSASRFELSVVRRESLSIKGPVRLRIHHLL